MARAAWLHFVGGLTQSDVAKRLDVPLTRAHRYISRAQSAGMVRVFVDGTASECIALETALAATYGLSVCRVAMEVHEDGPLPLRALGTVGADYLMQALASRAHRVIGVGHGRTVAAVVRAMGRCDGSGTSFVSMLGGLTRHYAANPHDVIHRLAEKTEAECYFMPAPLFANSAEDRRVLLLQAGLAAPMALIEQATLAIVGIGEVGSGDTITAMNDPDSAARLRDAGAEAEVLGQFIGADGSVLRTPYDARVVAPALDRLRGREVVAIAGGTSKTDAIGAVLRSGLLTGLIIDEATARALVGKAGTPAVSAAE